MNGWPFNNEMRKTDFKLQRCYFMNNQTALTRGFNKKTQTIGCTELLESRT